MSRSLRERRTEFSDGTVLVQDPVESCEGCGHPIAVVWLTKPGQETTRAMWDDPTRVGTLPRVHDVARCRALKASSGLAGGAS